MRAALAKPVASPSQTPQTIEIASTASRYRTPAETAGATSRTP